MITNKTKAKFFFVTSLASVIASIFLYVSVNDNKHIGIFVGLWAPTLMGLSNRYGIAHASDVAERAWAEARRSTDSQLGRC